MMLAKSILLHDLCMKDLLYQLDNIFSQRSVSLLA